MRPLELRLRCFGPYRDEAVLNFEALDRLFLVCGPTGAGKTTLFDALTYALYERTAGTRGGLTDQLSSHHAPEGTVPEVSLRFGRGTEEWRVTRQLRHRVAKKKGEGWTEREPQVLLEAKKPGGWEAVPGKRSELNAKLEDLVGLSADEFAKIVVLPQGDFQRFLEASSNERERMLQKLFPVEAYERLVEGVKLRAKAVEDERRRWEDRWQELTARAGAATDRAALEEAAAETAARAQECAREEAEAAARVVQLKALAQDWSSLEAKRAEHAALQQRRPAVELQRERAQSARQARPVATDLDRQDQITFEGRSLRAKQDAVRAELLGVETALAAEAQRAEQKAVDEGRLAQLRSEKGALEHQRVLWVESQQLLTGEAEATTLERHAEALHRRAVEKRTNAEGSLPAPSEGPSLEAVLAELETARSSHQRALAQAERAREGAAREAEVATWKRQEGEASALVEAAQRETALWTQVVEALKAAALADTLTDGKPCPVCGALHHPHPAAWPEASAEAPRRLETALAAEAAARQQWALVKARLDAVPAPPPEVESPSDLEATTAAVAKAQAAVSQLQSATVARDRAREAVAAALAEEATARERWQTALREREAWTTRRQTLSASAPDPTATLEALSREEAALQQRLEAERQRFDTLSRRRSELSARIDEQEKQLVAQREEYARLKARLEAHCATLGVSIDELKRARLPEEELQRLEHEISAFDAQDHRLAGETAALEGKFPQGRPDPWQPAQELWQAAQQRREEADAHAREAAFVLRDLDKIEAELREVVSGRQAVEADFQRLVPVAQTLDGRNKLNLKLTTWVLVQALEQVAASATHRLAAMSGGRYALKVQSQGLDGRRDWGLDLAVVDGYTGQERAVGTLSGGEKFMTSISLALGLADVIQEKAGGLKLEAIFIDEGFGTLDDQSLDRAMAILHDLGKNRSVGIISHVAELRQRISSRVEVIKGKNGSTLRVG